MPTGEEEAMYFFYKYAINLPYILSYIFIPKNPIFLYNFYQKWLDTLYSWNSVKSGVKHH
jgi:hypothetical protein